MRETALDRSKLVYPIFISAQVRSESPIEAMPGICEYGLDRAVEEIAFLSKKGLRNFLLFGVPSNKDERGSESFDEQGIVQQALRKIKKQIPESVIFTDVCLCGYTDHGHCGVIKNGKIDNDESVEILAKAALSHARAGADFVAPSDMMDGRVLMIRKKLDENGLSEVGILSYAAKFSSAFYGPFREAAHSAPKFGDRKSHQMDPANRREALRKCNPILKKARI